MNLKPLFLTLLFACLLSNITAQEITLFTGIFGWNFYQDDKPITRKYFRQLLSDVPAAQQEWKRAQINQGIGAGLLVAQIGFGVWLIDRESKGKNLTAAATAFGLSGLGSIIFAIRSMGHRRNSILYYNKSFDTSGIQISPAREGLGINIRF